MPKTLIYAKDDSHADDIVQIVREEFGKGNDFAQKITYRTGTAKVVTTKSGPNDEEVEEVTYKSSGLKAEDLLSSFRNSYNPRIVVTVDMIATGTDIKPLEIVMFMRAVRSRTFFEQMKGRGVRVINATELQAVTPDATSKTHFVIVDCVGLCEGDLTDSQPLERQPTVPFHKLLQAVAFGSTDPDILSSLAGRLARLDRQLGTPEQERAPARCRRRETPGDRLRDRRSSRPRRPRGGRPRGCRARPGGGPDAAAGGEAAARLLSEAVEPLASSPSLRRKLDRPQRSHEQTIDPVSQDAVLEACYSEAAKRSARGLISSFEEFLARTRTRSPPSRSSTAAHTRRLRYDDIKALADRIQAPPRRWTPEDSLASLRDPRIRTRVRGAAARRLLTDIVSLVRFALHREETLVPFPETVETRFEVWLARQEASGRKFTSEQRQWLE